MNPSEEIARLRAAKRRALQIADERSKENAALRQEVGFLRAALAADGGDRLAEIRRRFGARRK